MTLVDVVNEYAKKYPINVNDIREGGQVVCPECGIQITCPECGSNDLSIAESYYYICDTCDRTWNKECDKCGYGIE